MGLRGRRRTLYPISARPMERRGVLNVTEMEAITEYGEEPGGALDDGKQWIGLRENMAVRQVRPVHRKPLPEKRW